MNIAIAGATGFTGKRLSIFFQQQGVNITSISRKELQNDADVVINLAGATINKAWTKQYKKEILESRINTTKAIVNAINKINDTSKLLINASAVGIYSSDRLHDESSSSFADNFLSEVCKQWEAEAQQTICKLTIIRLGIVIAENDGFVKTIKPIFKLGIGAVLGNGKQPMAWIHIEDLITAINYIINHNVLGIVNVVAPQIITNKQFSKIYAKSINRLCLFSIPKIILKLIFGEKYIIMIEGQNVIPKKLNDANFKWNYDNIKKALNYDN